MPTTSTLPVLTNPTQSQIAIGLNDLAQQVTAKKAEIAAIQANGDDATAEMAAANALVAQAAAQMVIAQDAVKKAQVMLEEARGLGALLAEIVEIDNARKNVNVAVNGLVAQGGGGGGDDGGGGGGEVIPTDDVAILAEVRDHSLTSMDNQLGPKATPGMILPTVWERGQSVTTDTGFTRPLMQNFSTGLSVNGSGSFDYGSTSSQIVAVPDNALVITSGVPNDGLGLYRLRTEEHSEGQVQEAPVVAWNGRFVDQCSDGHLAFGPPHLGAPFKLARGKVNRYDGGVALYDESRGGVAYFGSVGTETAFPPWAGTSMPAGKVPLSIAIDSYTGFVYIGCYDVATNRGQLAIYWQWAGNDLQQAAVGFGFPFDFPVAHPGLLNSGVVTGVKLFGFFDLPIKWPTHVDCVCSPNTAGDRIEGPDGNASYLNIWPLETAQNRADFLAKNDGWIPTWGKACVTSKYENKAVMIDLTNLYAGVKDQYFGSQANYDQTRYAGFGQWYTAYDVNNPMSFPWGAAAKPSWAPVIGAVVTLPAAPTAMLMSELGDARVAIATADGNLRFFAFDGTPSDVVAVGSNPCHLAHDKGVEGAGVRRGPRGPIVTCRGSRSIVFIDKWATGAAVAFTLQDANMLDPVSCEAGDMHGAQMRYVTVCCFEDKTVRNYRLTDLVLATQGGAVFHMGPTDVDLVECGGVKDIPGHPFAVCGSNVN